MSNTFGHNFRVTTFGESHGGAVGVVIDGCPSGYEINIDYIQNWLDRRKPGQSHLSTPRAELDRVECLSGLVDGISLGTPITLMVRNKDAKKDHYNDLAKVYRPSHADYTTDVKFGLKAPSGGGRASARETIGRVAAAAVAEQVLNNILPDLKVVAFVRSIKSSIASNISIETVTREMVEAGPLRCPDTSSYKTLEAEIIKAKKMGDSVGGTIECVIRNLPPGIGEPVFDKLEAKLAGAMLSIPATKGFEIGSGFEGTKLYGSEHNDQFELKEDGQVKTQTNRSGGIQGGISNGENIYFKVAFKPTATIFKKQKTITREQTEVEMAPKQGRHDPCVLPRAVPIVEAMTLLSLMDQLLRQEIWKSLRGPKKI